MMPSSSAGGGPSSPVPADIQALLSEDQVRRLEQQLTPRSTAHPVDYRVSTALFGKRFYLTLLAGTEARSARRLQDEGHMRSFGVVVFEISMMCLAVSTLLIGSAAVIGLAIKAIYDAAQ
jgi:hypothetical protein